MLWSPFYDCVLYFSYHFYTHMGGCFTVSSTVSQLSTDFNTFQLISVPKDIRSCMGKAPHQAGTPLQSRQVVSSLRSCPARAASTVPREQHITAAVASTPAAPDSRASARTPHPELPLVHWSFSSRDVLCFSMPTSSVLVTVHHLVCYCWRTNTLILVTAI